MHAMAALPRPNTPTLGTRTRSGSGEATDLHTEAVRQVEGSQPIGCAIYFIGGWASGGAHSALCGLPSTI